MEFQYWDLRLEVSRKAKEDEQEIYKGETSSDPKRKSGRKKGLRRRIGKFASEKAAQNESQSRDMER